MHGLFSSSWRPYFDSREAVNLRTWHSIWFIHITRIFRFARFNFIYDKLFKFNLINYRIWRNVNREWEEQEQPFAVRQATGELKQLTSAYHRGPKTIYGRKISHVPSQIVGYSQKTVAAFDTCRLLSTRHQHCLDFAANNTQCHLHRSRSVVQI